MGSNTFIYSMTQLRMRNMKITTSNFMRYEYSLQGYGLWHLQRLCIVVTFTIVSFDVMDLYVAFQAWNLSSVNIRVGFDTIDDKYIT